MAGNRNKKITIHNKSDKPDNIIAKENEITMECEEIESVLPNFLRSFFIYLRGNVLPMTRLAYLRDIKVFFNYLISETDLTSATEIKEISIKEINEIKAMDVNLYLDFSRRYKIETDSNITVYENHNKTLARKKSSLSVMFKQLYRDELVSRNITDGFDPKNFRKGN